jgi:hypothetical protein
MTTKHLPRQSFRPIPRDSRAETFRGSHAEPRHLATIRDQEDGDESTVNPPARVIRVFELTPMPNPSRARKLLPQWRRCLYRSSATVSRFRPFARRRLRTIRPFFVAIRTKKPWAFFRLLVFGW